MFIPQTRYNLSRQPIFDTANKSEDCASSDLNINNAFTWTDASTKLFIDLYKEKKVLINRKIKTRKIMW